MKISVLSMNPGIDRVMYLSTPFNQGHMNRLSSTVTSQGSKGANCAILLHRLGCDVKYYSFTGGIYGDVCSSFTDSEGVPSFYQKTVSGIRVNSKLIDGNGVCSELNEPGGPFTEAEICGLTDAFSADSADIYILTGSLPTGAPQTLYAALTAALKAKGARVIMDCSGKALAEGVKSGPDLIKPNRDELKQLCTDCGFESDGDISDLGKTVQNKFNIETVLLTDGDRGSYLFSNEKTDYCPPSEVDAKGFSGAGDCFLCGYIFAKYAALMNDDDAHLFASCCGGAKVMLEGSLLPQPETIYSLFNLRKASR